jgi:hypothetical protein
VEEDEAADSVRIGLLGPDREVAHPRDGADAVQELRLLQGINVVQGIRAVAKDLAAASASD